MKIQSMRLRVQSIHLKVLQGAKSSLIITTAVIVLCRGLIEGEAPNYNISLGVAKNTHQLPSYTKTKGLDKEKLRQMILQYLKNTGNEGAKRDSIYEYIKDVLPSGKTEEQKLRSLGDILKAMKKEDLIRTDGRNWFEK